eukprot:TRINITY_DN13584_c0_g1_i1.p1 TRINITY_DN13584_c0_g1~~TRINITY_DN13584_c0_g1_i1.p1  ORF type:complete len:403 (+),score=138.06 TRINITY_DN13584_c0_g1_i1:730-1938(+)
MLASVKPMDDRCFPNPYPPLDGPYYSLPSSLSTLFSKSIKDQLVYLSSPSSYSALLGVSTSSILPQDDGTVYTGSAGLALLHLKLGNLTEADNLLEQSLSTVSSSRVTFLCGSPGPLAIQCVLHQKLGQSPNLSPILAMVGEVCDLPSSLPDELLYGRAGYLYTLLYLRAELGEATVPSMLIRKVVEAIIKSGQAMARSTKSRSPLMYAWHDKVYVGAAHGLSGILTMLLQAKDSLTPAEMKEQVRPAVDYLVNMQMEGGNFPSSKGNEKDRLIHWCHGAPGVTLCLLLAHQVWGCETDKYLDSARRAGEVVWARGLLKKGSGLCHGVAGNGYTFLHLYQVTGQEVWLYRAAMFGQWATELVRRDQVTPDRPLSLFEGIAGAVYFLHDLKDPGKAKFPCLMI